MRDMATSGWTSQEYEKQAAASEDHEVTKLTLTSPDVLSEAALMDFRPEGMMVLHLGIHLYFERDQDLEIKNTVTTLVHSHPSTAVLMDLERHIVAQQQQRPQPHPQSPLALQLDELLGERRAWMTENRRSTCEDRFGGVCWICGTEGHHSRECYGAKSRGYCKRQGDNKGFEEGSEGEMLEGKGVGIGMPDGCSQKRAFRPQVPLSELGLLSGRSRRSRDRGISTPRLRPHAG